MRRRRHNTLVNIVYNTLMQDHPGVLKKQGLLYSYVRVMFFILTSSMVIRLTLTSLFTVPLAIFYLLLSFLCWGGCCCCWRDCQACGSCGEGRFRFYSVWTHFALKQLQVIATPHSGVPRKAARKNLLQQLSVKLWTGNAKMILQYWSLQLDDDECSFFP